MEHLAAKETDTVPLPASGGDQSRAKWRVNIELNSPGDHKNVSNVWQC